MKTKDRFINIKKYLFYFSYTLILVYYLANMVYIVKPIRNLLPYFSAIMLIFLIAIQSNKYKLKSILLILSISVVLLFSYNITGDSIFILAFLLIIASKNIDFNEFLSFDAKIKIILIFVIIVAYKLGLAETIIKYRADGVVRNSLGFGHPNVLGGVLLSVCCEISYLKYKKHSFLKILFFAISIIICEFVCDSRSTEICILLLIILNYVYPLFENNKIIRKVLPFTFIILLLVSYYTGNAYGTHNSLVMKLDSIFSDRIRSIYLFLQNYNINLLGNYLEYYGMWGERSSLTVLDNAYMRLLIEYGIITTSFFALAFYRIIKQAYNENKYKIIVPVIVLLVYGLMENYMYFIIYDVFLMYLSNIIYYKNNEKVK